MKFCTKCGTKNEDNNLFCESCGEKFNITKVENSIEEINEIEKPLIVSEVTEQTTIISEDEVIDENEPMGVQADNEISKEDEVAEEVKPTTKEMKKQYKQMKKEEKKAKKNRSILKKIGIALFIIIISSIIILVAAGAFLVTRPQNKVILGLWQLSNAEHKSFTSRISMELDSEDDKLNEFISSTVIENKYCQDNEKHKFSTETSILVNDKSVLDLNIASENDKLLFQVPDISDKTLYFYTTNRIPKELDEFIVFMEFIYDNNNEFEINKEYIKVLYSNLSEHLENEDGKVIATLDDEEITTILIDLLNVIKEDEANIELIYSSFEEALKNMEEAGFEPKTDFVQDIFEEIKNQVDMGEKDFVKEYQNLIEDQIEQIDSEGINLPSENIKIIFNMDGYKIQSVAFEIEAMGMGMNYEVIPSEKAKEIEFSEEDSIDLEYMQDEDEVNKIIKDTLIKVLENKDVQEFINESEVLDNSYYDDVEEVIEEIEYTDFSYIITELLEESYYD